MQIITRGFQRLLITRGYGVASDIREIITFDSPVEVEKEWESKLSL